MLKFGLGGSFAATKPKFITLQGCHSERNEEKRRIYY